jgi:hypothetical protein
MGACSRITSGLGMATPPSSLPSSSMMDRPPDVGQIGHHAPHTFHSRHLVEVLMQRMVSQENRAGKRDNETSQAGH